MYPKHAIVMMFLLAFWSMAHAQETTAAWELEAMPRDLEIEFALSALPPHLRANATVYVLNPKKGYEIAKHGTNGFTCFISRTEWEWADFRKDHAAPISFDAEGSATIWPVYLEAARLRATGKYSALEVKNMILDGFKSGKFKAPSRAGVSYMLAPVMRTYPTPNLNDNTVVSMHMPHYMFYAPNVKDEDIGGKLFTHQPFIFNPAGGPHGYMIMLAGETERAKIIDDHKELLRRLIEYRSYFRVESHGEGRQ